MLLVPTGVWLRQRQAISSEKVARLDNIQIPVVLQQRLLAKQRCELMLLRYQDRKIQYIYNGSINYGALAIADLFKQLASDPRYKLPVGDYLFNLDDGVDQEYGWPILGFAAPQKLIAAKKVFLIPAPEILDLSVQDFFSNVDQKANLYPWDRKVAKIFWRGSLTGSMPDNDDLFGSARLRFLHAVRDLQFVDARLTAYTHQHNHKFLQQIKQLYPLTAKTNPGDAQAYKYLIDIDGNSASFTRMAWILYSNSLLFKPASENQQWYYDQLQPYVHYVPIAADFNDLESQFNWAQQNPQQAQAIAANGRELAREIFSKDRVLQAAAEALKRYHNEVKYAKKLD
jgi:hypothetical protein